MTKQVSAQTAIDCIRDGDTVWFDGCVGSNFCETITTAIEEKFLATGHPRDLTLVFVAGHGDGEARGLNRLGYEGLVKRVIGGHYGVVPRLGKLIAENKVEGYNFPSGVLAHMLRNMAGNRPTITTVGLHTYIDPRYEGGSLNDRSTGKFVDVIEVGGKEYLLYKDFKPNVAFLRGTYADPQGNTVFYKEGLTISATSLPMATKQNGGKVFVQVERIVAARTLDPKQVKIPGILLDGIVVAEKAEHNWQTYSEIYNPALSGQCRVPDKDIERLPLDARKIIGRRAAMELKAGNTVVVGIGAPEAAVNIAAEQGFLDQLHLIVDAGTIGGLPELGLNFGLAANPDAIIDVHDMFDLIDGGGLDIALLGMAQVKADGSVNVSKFGKNVAGCGGFVNLTQSTQKLVYCGTFTAGGLKITCQDGKLTILNEGKAKKLVNAIDQMTFNGAYAVKQGIEALYVTERAVFALTDKGLELREIAPGVDLEKDILAQMEFRPSIAPELKTMDKKIFED